MILRIAARTGRSASRGRPARQELACRGSFLVLAVGVVVLLAACYVALCLMFGFVRVIGWTLVVAFMFAMAALAVSTFFVSKDPEPPETHEHNAD